MARSRSRSIWTPLPVAFTAALMGVWLAGWVPVTGVPAPPAFGDSLALAAAAVALIALAVHATRAWSRRRLLNQHRTLADLQRLDWAAFERLVGEAYRQQGWSVEETGQGGADGGIDLCLRRKGHTRLVQVKHWRGRVGAKVVREMFGLLHHHGAQDIAIVALGGFTKEGVDFAVGKPIALLDGADLVDLINGSGLSVNPEAAHLDTGRGHGPSTPAAPNSPARRPGPNAPRCPACKARLVQRTRRSDGKMFWGCPNYPTCTGKRRAA